MIDFSSINEQNEATLTPEQAEAEFRSYAQMYVDDEISYGVYARAEEAANIRRVPFAAQVKAVKDAKANKKPRPPVDISGWTNR